MLSYRFDLSTRSSSDSSTATCPAVPSPVSDAHDVYPGWTINDILRVICYATGAAAGLISLSLFFLHAFNMRNPPEQIKMMRIILLIPIYAGLSIIGIVVGQNSVYVTPWSDFYEAVAMSSFFLLVCTYVGPDRAAHNEYFSKLEVKDKKKQPIQNGGLKMFNRSALLINQYVLVTFVIGIATAITQHLNIYCLHSDSAHFAHLWLGILIKNVSVTLAVTSVIRFTLQLRSRLTERPVFKQLLTFKLLIAISTLQSFGFSIASGYVTPTDTLSYNDITIGLPNTLLCIELVIFSVFFHVAFSHRPYVNSQFVPYYGSSPEDTRVADARHRIGALGAVARALNPIAIPIAIREIYRANRAFGSLSNADEERQELRPYPAAPPRYSNGAGKSRSPSPAFGGNPYTGRGL